jgi:hypothetical protein
MIMKKLFSQIPLFTLLLISGFAGYAQKLPNIQAASLRLPAGTKIEGKATEWNNQFQAYNRTTGVYYTIANDDENVYLAVQATDPHFIEKILSGGITFSVKSADKGNKVPPVSIDYLFVPVVERYAMMKKIKGEDANVTYTPDDINKQFTADAKQIQVSGIKEIQDTLISVYNDAGIKVAALFDDKKVLTYELSLPLKYLKESLGDINSFNYNIKLNAIRITPHPVGAKAVEVIVTSVRINSKEASDMQDLDSPTNFSGNYTMAK